MVFTRRLTIRSLRGKAINIIHYLSSFYYCYLFPNIQYGIIIETFLVPKICCVSRFISWRILLDPYRKRKLVMRMKVESNKGICLDFFRNFLGDCIDGHDDLTLVDPSMNLLTCQLQELPCFRLVLCCLEFIIHLI